MTNDVDAEAIAAAARSALPYAHPNDLAPLLAAIGDAQFVCLGESTHGTREFYELRAEITRRLVAEKGFSVVLVEGEWPAGSRVNRFISGVSLDTSAEAALASFEGFPKWMWRNAPTARLAEDLRQHNARARAERREQDDARAALEAMRAGGATNEQLEEAGLPRSLIEAGPCDGRPTDASFYGMDVYSVNASAAAVLEFLDIVDPEAASSACARYSVLSEYGDDMKRYGYESTRGIMASRSDEIQSGLVQVPLVRLGLGLGLGFVLALGLEIRRDPVGARAGARRLATAEPRGVRADDGPGRAAQRRAECAGRRQRRELLSWAMGVGCGISGHVELT